MKLSKDNKVTFKTEDLIGSLINQLFIMRPKLYQLIDQSPSDYFNPKLICSIIKTLPKSLERNKNRLNQLQLCLQLQKILDYFISMKQKASSFRKKCFRIQSFKHKPYQLLLYFIQFSEKLSTRIRAGVSGNIQQIVNNQQNYQLFYLINELDYLNKEIENWALKQDKKTNKDQHQSVKLIYPDKSSFRKTLATTADVSKNISKHEKNSTFDQMNQKSSEECLLRALSVKMKKRQLKMTTRCPSAASLLKDSSYKQPLFQTKRSVLKFKHKSTDFDNKTYRNNFDYTGNHIILQSNPHSRLKQTKNTVSKQRKISILNRSILKDEEDGIKVKSNKKIPLQKQKLQKTGIIHLGKRNKEKKSNILSNQEISSYKNHENSPQINSQSQILDPEIIEEVKIKGNNRQEQKKLESCENLQLQSNEQRSSLQSSLWKTQQNTIYIKQRQIYKKARRSGKVMIKDKDDFKDAYMINKPKPKNPSNFSRRRKAILSTHTQEMAEIQNMIKMQNQQKAQKQLEYDQNVLLAFSEALKTKKNIKNNKEIENKSINKHTFNQLFNEMNDFLKNYHKGKARSPQSVFFQQQKRIRFSEDYNYRQKMKALVKINGNLNVFDIQASQINKKEQVFNQIHRQITFNCDSDWIKNMFSPKQVLIQRQL